MKINDKCRESYLQNDKSYLLDYFAWLDLSTAKYMLLKYL